MRKIIYTTLSLALCCGVAFAETQLRLPVSFNPDDTVNRPFNYRQWVNVGTTLIPKGTVNIIDGLAIKSNEYIDTYVEPKSFAIYMATGNWPNGTQIVKEFTALKTAKPGEVTTESHYNGLALLVKDTERFSEETGYLGYFNFGHHREPYEMRSSLMPREQCSACHEASASHQQFIFSDHHIGLKKAAD